MPKLEYQVPLSFSQDLRENPIGSGHFFPASKTISPPGVEGIAKICFNEELSTLSLNLEVHGDLTGDRAVTLAHLHLDEASQTGPLTVELYPSPNAKVKTKKDRQFLLEVTLTNKDIIPRNNGSFATNTISSLYNAIQGRNLYVDVHGKGDYLLGMIRGQIYT